MLPTANMIPPTNNEMRCQSRLGAGAAAPDSLAAVVAVGSLCRSVICLRVSCTSVLDTVYPYSTDTPYPCQRKFRSNEFLSGYSVPMTIPSETERQILDAAGEIIAT